MPDEEPPAAGPADGSEQRDAPEAEEPSPTPDVSPVQPAAPKLGRVPYCEELLARKTPRGRARNRSTRSTGGFDLDRADRPDRVSHTGQKATRRKPFSPRLLLPWIGLFLFAGCLAGLLSVIRWGEVSPATLLPSGRRTAVVVLDPGHGGLDSGAIAQGVVEKDLNLDVGLRVARVLRAAGLTVVLTREDDHYVPLESRVEIANALPGAVFVSIHFNDAQGEGRATGRASGIETYYSGAKEGGTAHPTILTDLFGGKMHADNPNPAEAVRAGVLLAGSIQQALIANTAADDRGIKEAGLYVTRRVRGPAVLVEGGFVSHPQEAHLLQVPAYRQRIANSIAEGIVKFLQSAQPAPADSPPTRA